MPIKIALSWDWAFNWLKPNLYSYLKDYADDPQELKNIAGELIENEVLNIYPGIDYPEKQSILTSFKELYELLKPMSEDDWGQILDHIFPNFEQQLQHKPSFETILESIGPKQQLSMEDIRQEEPAIAKPEIKTKRPIESVMILHPKTRQPFSAGVGTKVYNSDKRSIGTIGEIYEDHVVVEENNGQLTNWPLTDQIWKSFK